MGAEYYLFALFIFALAAMLIVLVLRGKSKSKAKDDEEREERDKKIMLIYFEVEDMIEALREYVENSRERIEADIRRIETDMQALSTMRESLNLLGTLPAASRQAAAPPVAPQAERNDAATEPNRALAAERSALAAVAVGLKKEGKSVDEIAKEMHLSKTEVSFMLKLDELSSPAARAQKISEEKRLKF